MQIHLEAGMPIPPTAESSVPVPAPASGDGEGGLLVVCLCAQWCSTCRDYRAGFEALAAQFPASHFRWLDIEDEADALGDLDIENFPTLLIRRGPLVLFFGVLLPHLAHLRRLLETLAAQTPAQSRAYAESTPQHRAWQAEADLTQIADRARHD